MAQMLGAEDEAAGSILEYVTKVEFRKQRHRCAIITYLYLFYCHSGVMS